MSMREPTFLVLTALAAGRAHGYALLSEVESISQGRVRLQVGSLYAVLERSERDGLVVPVGDEVVNGRTRRYFDLTDAGRTALAAEADVLAANAEAAQVRLRSKRPTRPVPSA